MILAILDWRTVVREVYVVEAVQAVLGLFLFVYWIMLPQETKVNNFQVFLAGASICFVAGITASILMLVQWLAKWPTTVTWIDIGAGFLSFGFAYLCYLILRENFGSSITVAGIERGAWVLCGTFGMICTYRYLKDPRPQQIPTPHG